MSFERSVTAIDEPLSARDLNVPLRLRGDSSHKEEIEGLISTAREKVENDCGISIVAQTVTEYFDALPSCIELRSPPHASFTIAVAYFDGTDWQAVDGALFTVVGSNPSVVHLDPESQWPEASSSSTFQYRIVSMSPENVTPLARQAIILLVKHWFSNSEGEEPAGYRATIRNLIVPTPYRP